MFGLAPDCNTVMHLHFHVLRLHIIHNGQMATASDMMD